MDPSAFSTIITALAALIAAASPIILAWMQATKKNSDSGILDSKGNPVRRSTPVPWLLILLSSFICGGLGYIGTKLVIAGPSSQVPTITTTASIAPELAISVIPVADDIESAIQTQTQLAFEAEQTSTQRAILTATAYANATATQIAYEAWYSQHHFIDDFLFDSYGWGGAAGSTNVVLDNQNGRLIYTSGSEKVTSFWRCTSCTLPTDHKNYSFEIKYLPPEDTSDFNVGFLFGCTEFNQIYVSCQAIQALGNTQVFILQIGPKEIYQQVDTILTPNNNGIVSLRVEVRNRILSLWINGQLSAKDIVINNEPGGIFGLYQNPTGSTVIIERIEIVPLLP